MDVIYVVCQVGFLDYIIPFTKVQLCSFRKRNQHNVLGVGIEEEGTSKRGMIKGECYLANWKGAFNWSSIKNLNRKNKSDMRHQKTENTNQKLKSAVINHTNQRPLHNQAFILFTARENTWALLWHPKACPDENTFKEIAQCWKISLLKKNLQDTVSIRHFPYHHP